MSSVDLTSRVVIRCLGLANGTPGPRGQYLQSYDNETGESVWTGEMDKALVLTSGNALALYRSVLPSQPIRPWDGKPNRPLTAFSVEFVPVPEP